MSINNANIATGSTASRELYNTAERTHCRRDNIVTCVTADVASQVATVRTDEHLMPASDVIPHVTGQLKT